MTALAPYSPAGLLLDLALPFDRSTALSRAARRLARRLAHTARPSRALVLETADLTARLLDATDDAPELLADDLLDSRFDD